MTPTSQATENSYLEANSDSLSSNQLAEYSVTILQKPQASRTEKDIEILKRLTKKFEFFANIHKDKGEKLHSELCQYLNLVTYSADQIIFEAGSIGTTLYLILKGTVEIYVNVQGPISDNKEILVQECQKVNELGEGKMFGEKAITDEVLRPRKSTIKAKEDCSFITLEREHYQLIMESIVQELNIQANFLGDIPLFKNTGWTKRMLQNMVKGFSKHHYRRNHVIYKEGDCCDEVFVIRAGEVKCTKIVKMASNNKNFVVDENNNLYPFEEAPAKKIVEITILSSGQVFGEEEALLLLISRKETSYKMTQFLKQLNLEGNLFVNRSKDKQTIITSRGEEKLIYLRNLDQNLIRRETTMTVTSPTAEIWRIPAKIDSHKTMLDSIITMTRAKKIRREERIAEVADNVPTQPTSNVRSKDYLKENIVPFTKHKKHVGQNQTEQLVFCNMSYDFETNHDEPDEIISRQHTVEGSPSKPPAKSDFSPIEFLFTKKDNNLAKSSLIDESFSKAITESQGAIQRGIRQGSLVGWSNKHRGEERYRQKSLPVQETTSYYSSLKNSLKKILVVENPFNNSSFGHTPTNRSSKSSFSFLNEESRITNKQDNIIKQDLENFFNNSIRVKTITHTKKFPQRELEPNKKPIRTKTPMLRLDRESMGSFLLPPVNKSLNFSKQDAKAELKFKSVFKKPLAGLSNTPTSKKTDPFSEDSIRMSDFLPPSKGNSPFERRKFSIQGNTSNNSSPGKRHNNRYENSPVKLLQSLERYKDIVVKMREPDYNDASSINVLSISESIQAKKLGLANGRDIRELRASRGINNGNRTPQWNKAVRFRSEKPKLQELQPKDLQIKKLIRGGVNNQKDKIRESLQRQILEKYRKSHI